MTLDEPRGAAVTITLGAEAEVIPAQSQDESENS